MRKPGSSGVETLRNLRSAAVQLLAEMGYEKMSLRLLAKSIGVQASALYNYIDSKQQLLLWLVKEPMERLLLEIEAVNGIEDPVEQMRKFVEVNVHYYTSNVRQHLVLLRETRSLNAENYETIIRLERLYNRVVAKIIERGIAAKKFRVKDPKITTVALVQLLNALLNWYKPNGRLTPDQLSDVYTDLVFGMLHLDARSAFKRVAARNTRPRGRMYSQLN